MKGRLLIAVSLLLVAGGVAAVVWNNRVAGSSTEGRTEPHAPAVESALVGVDELMRNVDRYRRGPVRVEGVVSAASPTERSLALIDGREFEQCGLGCAELTLPIRWSGAMPAVRDAVRVEGEIQEDGGKLVLVARSVEKVERGGTR